MRLTESMTIKIHELREDLAKRDELLKEAVGVADEWMGIWEEDHEFTKNEIAAWAARLLALAERARALGKGEA